MAVVIISLVVLGLAGYAIAKNYEAKIILFAAGITLMICAVMMGKPILAANLTTVNVWFDPLKQIQLDFVAQYSRAGIIIMVLFGFAAYMSHIGANDVAIHVLSKPLSKIHSPYILVPIVYWVGSSLQLIIPSAASLAIILMATLFPLLRAAGMTSLTAAGIIACTATIVPTPLGGDNVKAAETLGFEHVVEYVFSHHARISIPVLIIMGFAHYFWQKFMDKRQGLNANVAIDGSQLKHPNKLPPTYYALFPVIPLILVIFSWLFFRNARNNIGLVEITLFSFAFALVVEIIRKKDIKYQLKQANIFFKGMGDGFSQVVVLIIAATTMVAGLKSIGLVAMISGSVQNFEHANTALMFIFSGITGLITFISGSGNAAFYSFIELIPEIAQNANVDAVMIALPMQLTSHLIRAISPVSAVVIIVASTLQVNPLEIVKRTSVPLLTGFVTTLIMALIIYQ